MPTKQKLDLELLRAEALNAKTHLLTFAIDPGLAAACRPGQFFNVRPIDSTAPLLRRPISICDARPEAGEMDLLVQTVGDGTRLITRHMPGARVDMVGPLGTWFEADPARPSVMVAGGVGVAPLRYLAGHLRRAGGDAPIAFCYGARSAGDFVMLDTLRAQASELVLATEDGSEGRKGFVTDAVAPHLSSETQIFVCGPSPMMNALLPLLRERGLEAQLSLENMMGCGVGACQGCVVPSREGHLRVCCDGPVVPSEKLDFVLAE